MLNNTNTFNISKTILQQILLSCTLTYGMNLFKILPGCFLINIFAKYCYKYSALYIIIYVALLLGIINAYLKNKKIQRWEIN